MRNSLPRFLICKCLKPDRLERGFEKARSQLLQEINIIEIVKSRRFFKKALKGLLSKKKRYELKERSRYYSIDPDKKDYIDKEGKQKLDRQRTIDENLYDATSAMNYTDGFFSSETEEIELNNLSQQPDSNNNTVNEEQMMFDDSLRKQAI